MLAYGMSKYKLADTIEIPVEEADRIIKSFFKQVPKVQHFLESLGNAAKQNGYIRTPPPYGRIRWFDGHLSGDFSRLGEIERAGKNQPIQGGNADLTKLALVLLYREIVYNNWPVKIIHTVHDEIQTEVLEEYAVKWKDKMNFIMEEAGKVIVKSIPMKVDCKIDEKWAK